MTEIIFRGYSKQYCRWLYGFLIADNTIREFGIKDKGHEVLNIGQFTGLFDKNGTKIFEGDILNVYWNHQSISKMLVSFDKGCFYCLEKSVYVCLDQTMHYLINNEIKMEVIGNIHDNPNEEMVDIFYQQAQELLKCENYGTANKNI